MKILFIIFNEVNKGTYHRAFGFGKHLALKGHEVTLITTSKKNRFYKTEKIIQPGLLQVEMPDLFKGSLRSGWDPWNTINRFFWLKNKHYDIVHAFESRPTVIYPALYMKGKGVPLIMDWCDWFGKGGSVEERPNPIVRMLLRPIETYFEEHFRSKASGSTVICNTLFQKLVTLGIKKESILLLNNGVEINPSLPIDKMIARNQLDIPYNIPVIGWVGATFKRDAELMAKSFDKLIEILPTAHLIIAGYFNHDFKKMVKKPSNVIQTGYLEEEILNLYLSAVDLFWLPLCNSNANRGRFPFKLTKYMSFSKPIVASAVGDIPFLFKSDSIGILVMDKPEEFADKTINLLNNQKKIISYGKNTTKVLKKDFEWLELTIQLEDFYYTILNKKLSIRS